MIVSASVCSAVWECLTESRICICGPDDSLQTCSIRACRKTDAHHVHILPCLSVLSDFNILLHVLILFKGWHTYMCGVQARPLLEGGHMTQHTPELRVRATVEAGLVSLADFVVQGEGPGCCVACSLVCTSFTQTLIKSAFHKTHSTKCVKTTRWLCVSFACGSVSMSARLWQESIRMHKHLIKL